MRRYQLLATAAVFTCAYLVQQIATVDRHDALAQLRVLDATLVSDVLVGMPYWIARSGTIRAVCNNDGQLATSAIAHELGDIQFFNTLGRSLRSVGLPEIALAAEDTEMIWTDVAQVASSRVQRAQQIDQIYRDQPECGAAIDDLLGRGEFVCQIDSVIQQQSNGAGAQTIGLSFDEQCMTPDLPQAVAERFPLEPVASPIWTRIKSRLAVIDHRGAQPDPVQSAGGAVGSSTLGSIDRLATLRPGR